MKVSIVIPTYFEEDHIGRLLSFLTQHLQRKEYEIVVVDGGSTDRTIQIVSSFADVRLIRSDKASRPVQLNLGAGAAKGDILYFVHADVVLPGNFIDDILQYSKTSPAGVYRYQFDSDSLLLKINAYFTRFPMMWCRGGDQTLFIRRSLFEQLGGYDEHFCVMEDFDILKRINRIASFVIMPRDVIVSARKYLTNPYFKVQFANLKAFRMYRRGTDPAKIRSFYKEALHLEHY